MLLRLRCSASERSTHQVPTSYGCGCGRRSSTRHDFTNSQDDNTLRNLLLRSNGGVSFPGLWRRQLKRKASMSLVSGPMFERRATGSAPAAHGQARPGLAISSLRVLDLIHGQVFQTFWTTRAGSGTGDARAELNGRMSIQLPSVRHGFQARLESKASRVTTLIDGSTCDSAESCFLA